MKLSKNESTCSKFQMVSSILVLALMQGSCGSKSKAENFCMNSGSLFVIEGLFVT